MWILHLLQFAIAALFVATSIAAPQPTSKREDPCTLLASLLEQSITPEPNHKRKLTKSRQHNVSLRRARLSKISPFLQAGSPRTYLKSPSLYPLRPQPSLLHQPNHSLTRDPGVQYQHHHLYHRISCQKRVLQQRL